jgi:microcystin-dependent protein
MTSLLRTNGSLTARTRPLTGDIKTSFVIDDHMGWLKCDGRSMDKNAFNLLFQVIGYTFGGSGQSFKLPDPQGRVMGSVGTVVDDDNRSRFFGPGTSVGELDHKLVLSEIPSHNHDDSTSPVVPNGGSTSEGNTTTSLTGITQTQTGFAQLNDPGHTHNYTAPNGSNDTSQYGGAGSISVVTGTAGGIPTGRSTTGITDTGHIHGITDPGHKHKIASNGGDQYHNNIQPTLFYGNSYIYCGVPNYGIYPFTTGRNPVLI